MPTRPPAKHSTAGWSFEEELLLYAVHGALHLIGYCDKAPKDAARMEQMQRNVLAAMGIHAATQLPGGDGNIHNVEEGAQRS